MVFKSSLVLFEKLCTSFKETSTDLEHHYQKNIGIFPGLLHFSPDVMNVVFAV
jgi:hypothetical protein